MFCKGKSISFIEPGGGAGRNEQRRGGGGWEGYPTCAIRAMMDVCLDMLYCRCTFVGLGVVGGLPYMRDSGNGGRIYIHTSKYVL